MEIETSCLDSRNYPRNEKISVLPNTIAEHKSATPSESQSNWQGVNNRQQLKCCNKSKIFLFGGFAKDEGFRSLLSISLKGDALCQFA